MPRDGRRLCDCCQLERGSLGLGTVLADVEATAEANTDTPDKTPPRSNGWGARKLLQRQIFGRGTADNETAPSISTVMVDAFNIVHDRIARSRLAGDPPDVMISPRLSGFGLFEFHRATELIDRGQRAAERVLSDVKYDLDNSPAVARPTVIVSSPK